MKTIEVRFGHDTPQGWNTWTDYIPADKLTETLDEAKAHGVAAKAIGEVSWQRQLAAMENPEL